MNLIIILVKLVLEWLTNSCSKWYAKHTAILCSSLYLHETSDEEVVRLIGNLSEDKAINENDVPTKVNKLSKFVLAPVLTRIFNKCSNEGFYPDCLKVTEVISIYKIWRTK